MELSTELKQLFIRTETALTGSARRVFMAGVVQFLGKGGQRRAETKFGWNRGTVRKGQHELASGMACVDDFAARGRKRAEEWLPDLLTDIRAIADAQTQTDPTFTTTHLYTRLTAAEIGHQLEQQKGYRAETLPSAEPCASRLTNWTIACTRCRKAVPRRSARRRTPFSRS